MCQVNCPKCQSDQIRSTDNQSLFHPTKEQVENENASRFDYEVYMMMVCDNCEHTFEEVFQIVKIKQMREKAEEMVKQLFA